MLVTFNDRRKMHTAATAVNDSPTQRALTVVIDAVAISAHAGTIASEIVTRAQAAHAEGDEDLRASLYGAAREILARARVHDAGRAAAEYRALHPSMVVELVATGGAR